MGIKSIIKDILRRCSALSLNNDVHVEILTQAIANEISQENIDHIEKKDPEENNESPVHTEPYFKNENDW